MTMTSNQRRLQEVLKRAQAEMGDKEYVDTLSISLLHCLKRQQGSHAVHDLMPSQDKSEMVSSLESISLQHDVKGLGRVKVILDPESIRLSKQELH